MAAKSSDKDRRMASDLKARGVHRTITRCVGCHAIVPLGGNATVLHLRKCGGSGQR
jgi:hypothetical protein